MISSTSLLTSILLSDFDIHIHIRLTVRRQILNPLPTRRNRRSQCLQIPILQGISTQQRNVPRLRTLQLFPKLSGAVTVQNCPDSSLACRMPFFSQNLANLRNRRALICRLLKNNFVPLNFLKFSRRVFYLNSSSAGDASTFGSGFLMPKASSIEIDKQPYPLKPAAAPMPF